MNFEKDMTKLSGSDLDNVIYYFRAKFTNCLPDTYYVNINGKVSMSKELTDTILKYCDGEEDSSLVWDCYVALIKFSKYLTSGDINSMIHHMVNSEITIDTVDFAGAINYYFPHYANDINYYELLEGELPYFLEANRDLVITKWLSLHDSAGRIVVEYLARNNALVPYVNALGKTISNFKFDELFSRNNMRGTIFSGVLDGGGNLTVGDFIEYYNLPRDLGLGVSI